MKNKKGNVAVIALIIVIVAITTGVITWLVTTKSQAPVQQAVVTQPAPVAKTQPVAQPTTPDKFAGWQSYSSTKYGFEFKYPSDWKLDNLESSNVVALDNNTTPFGELNFSYYASLKDYTDLYKLSASSLDMIVLDKTLAFSNMKKIDFAGTKAWAGTEASAAGSYVIYIEKNSHIYKIEFGTIGSESELSPIDKDILSTFKFTN